MHSFAIAAIAALAALPQTLAHGHVKAVKVNGKSYAQSGPQWIYGTKPAQAEWYSKNQDNGFVSPTQYNSDDITCHLGATNGLTTIEAPAGATLEFVWDTWPDSHKGPVMNYMARCNGDCTKVPKGNLDFFLADSKGYVNGKWASDELMANAFTGKFTIPAGLSGNFVVRHEIIALHSAGQANGAQNYPQCFNIKVTGSGSKKPCLSGADCRKGKELYKATDAGIKFDIYNGMAGGYPVPGPKIWNGLKKREISFAA